MNSVKNGRFGEERKVGDMSEIAYIKNEISTKVRSKVAEIMQLAIGVTPITKSGEDCKGPTVFVEYNGHVNNLHVSIFAKGWRRRPRWCESQGNYQDYYPDYYIWINIGDEDQDKVLKELNECYDLILDVSQNGKNDKNRKIRKGD